MHHLATIGARRSRRRTAYVVGSGLGVFLSLLSGCGQPEAADQQATDPSVSAPPSAAPAPPVSRESSTPASTAPSHLDATPPEDIVTAADRRLIGNFVAFAVEPSAATAARVPFAAEVRLGLSRDFSEGVDRREVSRTSAWRLEAEYFRAYTGPFDPLAVIARHADETGSTSADPDGGGFRVSVGGHPHCAGAPVPAPPGFADHRRVSVQPAEGSIDSCLSWFTVDLFLDEADTVVAVTLDLWEP